MPQATLLTGSDLGDRKRNLSLAKEMIERDIGRIILSSEVYESEAWGFESAGKFLNQALVCETELTPLELLDAVQGIERSLGRERSEKGAQRYESRIIDIDILFYDDLILNGERLTIPHPLICEREFVLAPLREIMGDFTHPAANKKIREL